MSGTINKKELVEFAFSSSEGNQAAPDQLSRFT
jgi:hypothetical protein